MVFSSMLTPPDVENERIKKELEERYGMDPVIWT